MACGSASPSQTVVGVTLHNAIIHRQLFYYIAIAISWNIYLRHFIVHTVYVCVCVHVCMMSASLYHVYACVNMHITYLFILF